MMAKRLLLIVAMAAALIACTPSDGTTSPGAETLAPIETMGTESVAPSP
jgi:hypothetical protein